MSIFIEASKMMLIKSEWLELRKNNYCEWILILKSKIKTKIHKLWNEILLHAQKHLKESCVYFHLIHRHQLLDVHSWNFFIKPISCEKNIFFLHIFNDILPIWTPIQVWIWRVNSSIRKENLAQIFFRIWYAVSGKFCNCTSDTINLYILSVTM